MNEAPKKPPTLEELIEEKLGPDFDQEAVDHDWRVSWFPAPGKTSPRNLDIGQRWPANPYLRIYLIFGDEDAARVYCYPDLQAEADEPNACKSFLTEHAVLKKEQLPKHLLMPTVFRLSMLGPVYRASSMTTERFVEKVVEEFEELAGDDLVAEERIAVVDYLRAKAMAMLDKSPQAGAYLQTIAQEIEDEEHLDDEEEGS
jgi:hypothetical protein